jgi:hypothetical protein
MSDDRGRANGRSATDRAEEMLDRLGTTVGRMVARARPRVLMLAALAREEAEDIWAEAQHLRAQRRAEKGDAQSE